MVSVKSQSPRWEGKSIFMEVSKSVSLYQRKGENHDNERDQADIHCCCRTMWNHCSDRSRATVIATVTILVILVPGWDRSDFTISTVVATIQALLSCRSSNNGSSNGSSNGSLNICRQTMRESRN
ncbi:hypothetical protein M0804_002861 [Polistes exclamans]|nr:hypothetical protein M0804_002861 [Polistes exclamans]